ncbi:reverse transcriptase domain-containing protein [Tanacetum coccineum]
MTGIPIDLSEHKLNIHPRIFPIRQKKRILAKERNEAITQEASKLVEARILREVYFPRWVANPVMVRKNDGTWRMCIDFTSLNKACLKDSYSLPEIDQKIESLKGFKFKCFLGTYKGYHQIQMSKEDEEKTSHMITKEGIEASPEKVKAIIDMVSPQTIQEVQSLNGKLAALGRFLAKSAEKALLFFKTLKGHMNKKDVRWNQEVEEAFQELKLHLQSLAALTVPIVRETLILYLAVSRETISSVLMAKRNNIQRPIYFVSKALQGPKLNYPLLEKLTLALVHTASKWAIELGEHDITYKLRSAIKGQVIADFIAETPRNDSPNEHKGAVTSRIETQAKTPIWTLYIDGASINEGSGAGLILTDPDGKEITYALRFEFSTSNNEAKYEALIAGLVLAIKIEVRHLQVQRATSPKSTQWGNYRPTKCTHRPTRSNHLKLYITMSRARPYNAKSVVRHDKHKQSVAFLSVGVNRNVVSPFPEAPGRLKFLVVAVNYFTKWVEAAPLVNVTGKTILKFVWSNIVCRFRIPGVIISDNRNQFAENPFREWCDELKIKEQFTSVAGNK